MPSKSVDRVYRAAPPASNGANASVDMHLDLSEVLTADSRECGETAREAISKTAEVFKELGKNMESDEARLRAAQSFAEAASRQAAQHNAQQEKSSHANKLLFAFLGVLAVLGIAAVAAARSDNDGVAT